jgi:GST-like protein
VKPYTLFYCQGCGSSGVEAALELAGANYRREPVDPWEPGPAMDRLRALNPLAQIPTLLTPGGEVLTESVAILIHLIERFPDATLAPPPGSGARTQLWRWLVFLATNIYAAVGVGDHPERWVSEKARDELVEGSIEVRKRSWRILEEQLSPAPFLLGAQMTVLDIQVAMMSRWRPRRVWFDESCPKLAAAVRLTEESPIVAEVWARNFE